MDELELTPELLDNITSWMTPKYAIGTSNNRQTFLKKMFDSNKVYNRDVVRSLMRGMKYQHQRANLVMINKYCYENDINFSLVIPGIKKQATKIPEIMSFAEVRLMVDAAPKPYDLCIRCIFNMGAGLRISEIIKFSWKDIRWVDWLSNQEKYGVAIIKSGKGSKDRIVNIPKNLMHDLYEYAKECNVLNEYKIPSGGMIFPFGTYSPKKQKKSNDMMSYDLEKGKDQYIKSKYNWFRYHILQQKCEKALNKHVKIHSLRHSRATYMYEVEKVPVEKIQTLLGHSSINTTMLYTKINPLNVFEMIKDTKEV